jgi:hypothetical protein
VYAQRILNTTRTLFGRHRSGHIFPMVLNVARMDTEFAGVIQRIQSRDDYIMFLSESLIVTAATQDSMALLGVRRACAETVGSVDGVGGTSLHIVRSVGCRESEECPSYRSA